MSDANPAAVRAPSDHPAWLALLLPLATWHVWMTLGLFGSWERLTDNDPVISGRHALHLYHGALGARALGERGSLTCYDPAFDAGYPKTPVFDSASRPAELSLLFVGTYSPVAYKIGLAVSCLLVLPLMFLAARGFALKRGISVLTTALALLVWWSRLGRNAIEAGDLDLLLAALFALVQMGLLMRYHEHVCILALVGVVVCGGLGYFCQPLFMLLMLPLLLVYYLTTVHRHKWLWHMPLAVGLVVTVVANAFWLVDYVSYWWVRVPMWVDEQARPGMLGLWEASVWSVGFDRWLVVWLLGLALLGAILLYLSGQRPAARLCLLGMVGLLALVVGGLRSNLLARTGACQLLVPSMLFATLPASFALVRLGVLIRRRVGSVGLVSVLIGIPALTWAAEPELTQAWAVRLAFPKQLQIGLAADDAALVDHIREYTTNDGRILWEDYHVDRLAPRWTALLPVLTDRAYIGGLDECGIEHASCGLTDARLAGRSIEQWTDAELADYCRRYNVCWVVCGEMAKTRLERWASQRTQMPGGRWLFSIQRTPSYTLAGRAEWRSADASGILLAGVEPVAVPGEEEGQVLLSLHYQAGMRVSPSRVRIEKALDPRDNIPFVRLRMKEAAGRVLIRWEGR